MRAILLLSLCVGCAWTRTPAENEARRARNEIAHQRKLEDYCARRGQVFDGEDIGRVGHTVRCRPAN